jgi:tryptophanyl-tRNA synthetase
MYAENLNKALEPFRAKRAELAAQPDIVPAILADGARRARIIAEKTMAEVRAAVQLP